MIRRIYQIQQNEQQLLAEFSLTDSGRLRSKYAPGASVWFKEEMKRNGIINYDAGRYVKPSDGHLFFEALPSAFQTSSTVRVVDSDL